MRSLVIFLLVLATLAGAAVWAMRAWEPPRTDVPLAVAARGDFAVTIMARGLLRATKATTVSAPNLGVNGSITELADLGVTVKEKDVVMALDTADLDFGLEGARSSEEEADQNIAKNRADAAIRENQDRVTLLKAEFAVRRAELDLSRNEMLSQIDAEKNRLSLEAAKRTLAQLKEDVKSRRVTSEADLQIWQGYRVEARFDREQAERRLRQTRVPAPMAGMVNIRKNRDPFEGGGGLQAGIEFPDFRVGDQVNGGAQVLEVIDTASLEMAGRIPEYDRGFLNPGQEVVVRIDSVPGVPLKGRLKSLGDVALRDPLEMAGVKSFEIVVELDAKDNHLRPGMSATIEIFTARDKDAVTAPLQAIFDREGHKVVHVWKGERFETREVTLGIASESRVQILKGVSGGERLAMIAPDAKAAAGKKKKSSSLGL